jgi:alkylation response protein AidB-like acyl-CoA dehydrogenase
MHKIHKGAQSIRQAHRQLSVDAGSCSTNTGGNIVCEMARLLCSGSMSKGLQCQKELSSAKWLASELAVRASAEAIRIHGAYGCTDDYPIAHHYRDAVLTTILGGTTEMHKLTIGRELL